MMRKPVILLLFVLIAATPAAYAASLEVNGGSITLDGIYNYDYVNVTNGGIIYISAYNGTGTSGTLFLNVKYDLYIDSTSSIIGASRGYRGGNAVGAASGGNGGENGGGNGVTLTGWVGGGGGGGGYGTIGGSGGTGGGCSGNCNGGTGGATYGTSTGWDIAMGAGAGGGGGATNNGGDNTGKAGQPGGAKLIINATNININGTLNFNGGSGGAGGNTSGSDSRAGGGGGGAAGGGILLNATYSLNISNAVITANGGSGGIGGETDTIYDGSPGQTGGGGRIKLFYRVIVNTGATVSAGTVSSISVNNIPTVPQISSPINDSILNANTANITWSQSTDPDGDNITYHYQVSNLSDFSYILSQSNISATSSGIIALPEGVVYARVRSNDSYNNSNWSTTVTFELYLGVLVHVSPANTSTLSGLSTTLVWKDGDPSDTETYQVSTDYQFINIVASGSVSKDYAKFSFPISGLSYGTQYYWHVKNDTDAYTSWWTFTTPSTSTVAGRINATVRDEQTLSQICTFNAQVYNTATALNKTASSCWANFSSLEVVAGEYLLRIVPNSSYASRSLLITSPTNATVYLPSTGNTINTIAFYILDYTGNFPWDTSILEVWKNNTMMHSSYFDADGKVGVNLISGDSYVIRIRNGNNLREWGNYVSYASGNIQVPIMDLGINRSRAGMMGNFDYNITRGVNTITLRWQDYGILNSLNFTIYEGSSKVLVHQLITSVGSGSSEYSVTNTSDIYYVYFSANTAQGTISQTFIYDYRWGSKGPGDTWGWGTFTISDEMQSNIITLLLIVMMAGFGAFHSGLGVIVVFMFAGYFWSRGWLELPGAGISLIGGLLVLAVISYLRDHSRTAS